MKKNKLLFYLAFSSLFLSGCVSKKKYLQIEKSYVRLENALQNASENIKVLEADTAYLGDALRQSQQKVKTVEEYSQYSQSTLSNKLKELELTLAKQEFALQGRDKYLTEQASKLAAKELLLESKSIQLQEVQALINQENAILDSLNAVLTLTLESFDKNELTVLTKNGRVYISMSDNLLFPKGSIEVSQSGKNALKKLAEILQDQNDIIIHVEGHTDDKPINGKAIRNNWDLSVLRATSVTQILVEEGILPWRIIPSGRAEYSPIVENITKEDRQINRRTEIILEPNMRPLLKLLEKR
jgi:chemotaxis protein MotB